MSLMYLGMSIFYHLFFSTKSKFLMVTILPLMGLTSLNDFIDEGSVIQ